MTKYQAVIVTIIASLIFGSLPFFVARSYAAGLDTFDVIFFRFFIAAFFFFAIVCYRRESFKLSKAQIVNVLAMAVVGYVLMSITYFWSFHFISTGLAATIHFAYPLIVTVLSFFFYRQKLAKLSTLALIAGSAGIILIAVKDFSLTSAWGIALAFLSGVFFAVYVLLAAHPALRSLSTWQILFHVTALTAVIVFAGKLCLGATPFANLTATSFLYVVYLAVIGTVLALTFFMMGIKKVGPATASILVTLEPVTTVLLGVLFLNEPLTLLIIGGCLLVLSAVVLISWPQGKR